MVMKRGLQKSGSARLRSIFAFLTAVSTIFVTAPASAAVLGSQQNPNSISASGLIVKYRSGVHVAAASGQFLGSKALKSAGFSLRNGKALGAGWHSVTFEMPQSLPAAQAAAAVLAHQPGVLLASIDQSVTPAFKAVTPLTAPALSSSKTISAAQRAKATDGWQASSPNTAAISVSWQKPLTLGGGKLHGYRLQVSIDAGNTTLYSLTVTGSKTSAILTREVVAGQAVSVRIAAVVQVSGALRVGRFTKWVTANPTTVPSVPKFITEPVATRSSLPKWQLLEGPETGGLNVTYTATASIGGQVVDSCTTESDSCGFAKLEPGVQYSVQLKASNLRGSALAFNPSVVADPLFQYQWALDKTHGINAESAWTRTTGQGVVVAVIDSGITEHPDLAGQLFRNTDGTVYGYDFVTSVTNSQDGDGRDANPADPNAGSGWHGTHVSGIIAAAANDQGVIGVAPGAKLLEVRALGANGGVESDLLAALHWATGVAVPGVATNLHPAKVVNLSLGYIASCDSATTAVLKELYDAGVTVITAAGNDNSFATISYPGNCVPTINVGATAYNGDRAHYSNFGVGVDISAPGGDQLPSSGAPMMPGSNPNFTGLILSTYNDGAEQLGNANYGYEQGTSMAAPFVTGVVALIYAARPDFTPAQIWQALQASATAWGPGTSCASASANQGCGVGILNAGAALTWALSQPKK